MNIFIHQTNTSGRFYVLRSQFCANTVFQHNSLSCSFFSQRALHESTPINVAYFSKHYRVAQKKTLPDNMQ